MKINPIVNPNVLMSYQTPKIAPVKAGVKAGRDEVTFSEEALSFSKVMAEVESRTLEERVRIANITSAVRQGTYKIDSSKIADKIIESALNR